MAPRPSDGRASRKRKAAEGPRTTAAVRMNPAESPLAVLARHKSRDGSAFLASAEIEAGDRFRSDCEKANIRPGLGTNWQFQAASGHRGGGAGGLADLTAAALDARRRIDRALDAVGPDLSGLLLDICCFLKGMEQIELERQWPRRSAKLVVKTGLGLLARHYGLVPRGRALPGRLRHWGTGDHRPTHGVPMD